MPGPVYTIKRIGNCTLIGGDCRKYLKVIPYHSIGLVLTDPPYGISYETNYRILAETPNIIFGDLSLDLLKEVVPMLSDKLGLYGAMYCFCSPKNIEEVKPIIAKYLRVKNLLVWDKGNWTAGDLYGAYGFQYEHIIYAVKTGSRKLHRRMGDIFLCPRTVVHNQIHIMEKPVALLRKLIENTSNDRDIVIDPFMGSGSTGIACIRSGRKFIGCEINEIYYQSAVAAIEWEYARLGYSIKESPQTDSLGGSLL